MLIIHAVFEGWYWRVTLPGDGQSFALIYSIEDPGETRATSGVGAQVMGPDDGYLIQYSSDVNKFWADRYSLALGAVFSPARIGNAVERQGRSDSRSTTPKVTNGMMASTTFDREVGQGFQASATWHQGNLVADDRGAAGHLKSSVSGCRWAFSVTPRVGWGTEGGRQKATAGWLAALPVFEPHWQVLMADGEATGWIEWGGKRYEFEGAPAYAEKNWGGGFPARWVWVQCNSFQSSPGTSVTAVGARRGLLQVPGIQEDVGMIGIHHEGVLYELNVRDSAVSWDVDPWGTWKFKGKNSKYEAEVEATCRAEGTPLRAPTAEQGLAPFCRDSFAGSVRIRLWKAGDRARGANPIIDCQSEGLSGAVEVGGGPWWSKWQAEAAMSEPIKQMLNLPIDVEALADLVPPPLRPPGL